MSQFLIGARRSREICGCHVPMTTTDDNDDYYLAENVLFVHLLSC